jgi:hypothetical protein
MNKRITLLLLIVFFCSVKTDAQQKVKVDTSFINYLCSEQLKTERHAYYQLIDFESLPQDYSFKDMLYLSAALGDTMLLKQISPMVNDTINLTYFFYASLILNAEQHYLTAIHKLKENNLSSIRLRQLSELMVCYKGLIEGIDESQLFYTTVNKIKKLRQRSVLLAGFFSALMPGLGKYYLMQGTEGNAAFSLCLITAAPFIECVVKLGLLSAGTIATGLIFVPVYVSNIYGTVKAKKSYLNKLNEQLNHEVIDYCTYQLHH